MRGIGEALARHTAELVTTGRLPLYIPGRNDSKSDQSHKNPYATILAHPASQLLLARESYAIDMKRIIDEASRSGVAIGPNVPIPIDWT